MTGCDGSESFLFHTRARVAIYFQPVTTRHSFDTGQIWPAQDPPHNDVEFATVFPDHLETGTPEELAGRDYACSSPESSSYREATQFRSLSDMDWTQARIALNRLIT